MLILGGGGGVQNLGKHAYIILERSLTNGDASGPGAILAQDDVDVDLVMDVQRGTTVDAFILGPEVTVVADLKNGTYPSISWVLNAPSADGNTSVEDSRLT